MTDPPTDRPDIPPWLEDVAHLTVVLDSLAGQVLRALEAGVSPRELLEALDPLLRWLLDVYESVLRARVRERDAEWLGELLDVRLRAAGLL